MDFGARYPEAVSDLATTGADAFHIKGATSRALREAGVPGLEIDVFLREAATGGYDNLLRVMMSWVSVTDSRDPLDEG